MSDEIVALAQRTVPSTAIVTGQTKDFDGASGSAWLFDPEHLVTNRHVIDGLVEPVWVRFPDCRETVAEVVGSDPLTDLAVLRVPAQRAAPLPLRRAPARLGELCFALGSPLGRFPESMSLGIVSGLKRSLPTDHGRAIYDIIQTDCAINPGNSGGPLVGVDGAVLGVNTAIASNAEGIGFAVPAETVNDIVPELLQHGVVLRASLGVSVACRRLDADDNEERLVVTAVRSNSAGPFERGDVLLNIGPHSPRSREDLVRMLRRGMVEQRVTVQVLRNGQSLTFDCVPSPMA